MIPICVLGPFGGADITAVETQVLTPQKVFMQPQRLVVPLFQRPYVWNQENQWEPLWQDVERVAERRIANPLSRQQPHFLGAVVLQQVQKQSGHLQERTIIDGQQRLTTLQLLMDALHAELMRAGATQPAMRLGALVTNAEPFCSKPEDRFKVWPTNRDRPAFNAVMGAAPPVDYEAVGHSGERMVLAHRFFSEQARDWLNGDGPEAVGARSGVLEEVVRELLQMVVIDLGADENAQEIFETLNARGSQLTAADLIKNLVFQRLTEDVADVEAVYQNRWKAFETAFWEEEVGVGRLRYHRSSVFLNHWLAAVTGQEIPAREVFERFKRYATHESGTPMIALVDRLHRAAAVYQAFVASAESHTGPIDRLGLFAYRTGVLESEVVKPLMLAVLDPEKPPVPAEQLNKLLSAVESWMVRRMLARATTKSYNKVFAELVDRIRSIDRATLGDAIEHFFANQRSDSRYWPDDKDLERDLSELLAYRRLGRGRLRMVLEAIEDYKRGWKGDAVGLGEERVARGRYAIEHIMPRKWQSHWPLPDGVDGEARDRQIHTIGNLTLLTTRLNSKVSNGPWSGTEGKRSALAAHDVLMLNRDLRKLDDDWTDASIATRTEELARVIAAIWPVPPGHKSGFFVEQKKPRHHRVELADLIEAGLLTAGAPLYRRSKKTPERVATLLADGRIELNGRQYDSPSMAAVALTGHATNGWWFFLVQQSPRKALKDVWREYVDSLAVDAEDEDDDELDDDES